MKWSEKAWLAVQPIYKQTIEHPFIQELMNGTLDRSRFIFYLEQDAIYLADYGRLLTALASRLTDPDHSRTFVAFAAESIVVEQQLHETFFTAFGIDRTQTSSPSCLLYTSFLMRQLNEPVEVMAAALLPCFRVYQEVGNYIFAHSTAADNPYRAWIDTYGGDEFAESVRLATAICDDLADLCTETQQAAMTEAFAMSTRLEWMFWDSAYRLEKWKI